MANYHVILKNQLQDYLSSATYDYPTRDYNSCAAEYAFRHGIPCFPLGKESSV